MVLNAEGRLGVFVEKCKSYITSLGTKSEALVTEHTLCSSDIIKSYFGKLKHKLGQNPKSGLTEFAYMIGIFGRDFSDGEAKRHLNIYVVRT